MITQTLVSPNCDDLGDGPKSTIERAFSVEFALSSVKHRNDCTFQVFVQFHHQLYIGFLPRCVLAHTASAVENTTSKPFWARVVLTTMALMAAAGASPALISGFRLGCSVMNSAIGGLTL